MTQSIHRDILYLLPFGTILEIKLIDVREIKFAELVSPNKYPQWAITPPVLRIRAIELQWNYLPIGISAVEYVVRILESNE